MKWIEDHETAGSLDENAVEWEEHWNVLGFEAEPATAWIGLLGDPFGQRFRHGQPHSQPGVFANVVNFRGFPHIPGNDFVVRYPVDGEPGHSGGSLQS